MKRFIIVATLACLGSVASFAQKDNKINTVTSVTTSTLSPLLGQYYNIKDALVAGDATVVAAKATEFRATINAIDTKMLPEADRKSFLSVKDKLATDADNLSSSNNIGKQRESFASFSNNFISLVKSVKLSPDPLYQMYCPMKKANWLSNESSVKNPYFGKQMLSCGKVVETIK